MEVQHWKTFQVTKINTGRLQGEKKKNNNCCRHNINLNFLVVNTSLKVYRKKGPCKLPTQILRATNDKCFLRHTTSDLYLPSNYIHLSLTETQSLLQTWTQLSLCSRLFRSSPPDRNSSFVHRRCVKLLFVYVVVIAPCQRFDVIDHYWWRR